MEEIEWLPKAMHVGVVYVSLVVQNPNSYDQVHVKCIFFLFYSSRFLHKYTTSVVLNPCITITCEPSILHFKGDGGGGIFFFKVGSK